MATTMTTTRAVPRHPYARVALDSLSAPRLLTEREVRGGAWNSAALLDGAWVAHSSLVPRLAKVATLEGHRGCVNHLRWNRSGALLASGSDDHQVIVWDYATRQPRESISTGHTGNIFAVCFVPETNDHIIASAAADYDVRLHYAPFRADSSKLFRVHNGRVKDIGTSWGVPKVFWSVAEDGVVFQFDLRALPTTSGRGDASGASGAIVRLGRGRGGRLLRGMGMATHPLDPTKFALACGDYYTRLYDHRMLQILQHQSRATTSVDATVPVEVFAPPHLHLNAHSDRSAQYRHEEAHGTSIQFSSDGAEILANYHSDHIYLFGVSSSCRNSESATTSPTRVLEKPGAVATAPSRTRNWRHGAQMDETRRPLPLRAAEVKALYAKGLVALLARHFVRALKCFSPACSAASLGLLTPSFRVDLFHSSAKAYLGRGWSGDFYLAAVYCRRALELDGGHREINLTYIKALHADKRTAHARALAQMYQLSYPEFVSDVRRYLQFRQQPELGRGNHGNRGDSSRGSQASMDDESEDDDESANRSNESGGSGAAGRVSENASSTSGGDGSPRQGAGATRVGSYSASDASNDGGGDNPNDDDSDDDDDSSTSNNNERSDSDDSGDADVDDSSLGAFAIDRDEPFWQSTEVQGRAVNYDVVRRYIGYCNCETDIKEAAFFGGNDAYIVAGSDDGRAYFWHKASGKLVNAIAADQTILNCVRPHPFDACIATSGIEDVIRLWSPVGEAAAPPSEDELDEMTQENQAKMANDSWGFYVGGADENMVRVVFQAAGGREGAHECATN
ncbi:hypothetical protein PybrP1_001548 [[Pythium] brassicae (nom. inval.)]|nr:hypothetical protein PybrP1_001548 [[Pythium] brassicae (nom. inval.)]